MNTVGKILKTKGETVWTISKDALVSDALKIFVEKRVGAVVVMEGEKIAGIFTERDMAQRVGFFGISPGSVRIGEVMTKKVITVKPSQSVNDCMALMTENHFRHLPVVKNGRLVGILSIGDIVKDIIEELQFMVEQLENYIKGMR
jgi:CBS domain-containing protein